ncbi:MAG: ParA family protein [Bacteriovoracaceae bacterium]
MLKKILEKLQTEVEKKSVTSQSSLVGEGKVVALLNQKGGVGKTTLAFNLAHALYHQNKRVLCIDMDPQANLSLLFNVDSKDLTYNIFHLLINTVRELKPLHTPVNFSDVVKALSTKTGEGELHLLPAGQELSGFELSVSAITGARQLILKQFIEKNNLKSFYDYIIIDGPPTLGLLVVNILCASEGVLVPFQPDQFSRKGLSHFHEALENIADMGIVKAPKVIGYIPNLVEARRKQVGADFEDIRNDLKEGKIFEGLANKVQMIKAGAVKKSVFDFKGAEYKLIQDQFSTIATHIGEVLS